MTRSEILLKYGWKVYAHLLQLINIFVSIFPTNLLSLYTNILYFWCIKVAISGADISSMAFAIV